VKGGIAKGRTNPRAQNFGLETMMTVRMLTATAVLFGLASASALAQNTLGELLDTGGKKLTKEELVAALSGANLSGETREGSVFKTDYKADGTYSGSFVSPQKRNGTTFGTWTVADTGKLCTDGSIKIYEVQPQKVCLFYFKNGDQYYISPSDTDRGAMVSKRAIQK
jgi:hypothetical protein